MADLSHHTRELSRGSGLDEPGVRDAIRAGAGISVAALIFLFVADVWIGTCTGSLAQAAGCAPSQQTMLTLGAPVLLAAGAVWSLVRAARTPRDLGARSAWQGAGLVLLALAVGCAVLSFPSLTG